MTHHVSITGEREIQLQAANALSSALEELRVCRITARKLLPDRGLAPQNIQESLRLEVSRMNQHCA